MHIVTNGSRKKHLQYLAVGIFKLYLLVVFHIIPRRIPRCQNELADFMSKIINYDDWYVSVVLQISETEKRPDTTLVFLNPGCEAVDAFSKS